jgi:hypothetical protein
VLGYLAKVCYRCAVLLKDDMGQSCSHGKGKTKQMERAEGGVHCTSSGVKASSLRPTSSQKHLI